MTDLSMMKESHLINCSATDHSTVIPCKALEIIIQYHSPDTIRLIMQMNHPYTSIKTDIHSICFFDHGALKSQSTSRNSKRDSPIYEDILSSHAKDIHWIRVRQQNPDTLLWSMCEIRIFAFDQGRRTSVCIEWFYMDIPFPESKEGV